jgi:hypothetical protein
MKKSHYWAHGFADKPPFNSGKQQVARNSHEKSSALPKK